MDTHSFPMTKASRLLADVATIWFQRWPETIINTPVVVVTGRMVGSPDAIVDHVRQGGTAVLCCSPTSTTSLTFLTPDLFGPFAEAGTNPLVAADEVTAKGVGPLDGIEVTADQSTAVHTGTQVLVTGEQALATQIRMAAGTVTVFGSAGMFADGLLGTSGNATALWWAVTGNRDTPAVSHSDRPDTRHPEPAAVDWGDHPGLGHREPTMRAVAHAARLLPPAVHDALCDFVDTGHPSGALLIRGVPFGHHDDLPPTPPHPTAAEAHHHASEFALLTVARKVGQPVGYLPEHGGDLVQNIVPVKASANQQVSTSSSVTLMWHTEAAFHPHRPRFLLLACLRGDPAAATLLASIEAVVSTIPDAVRDLLRQPLFVTSADESYVGRGRRPVSNPGPVLTGSRHRPQMVFDADLMRGVNSDAQRALEVLGEAIDSCHESVTLTAGDILIVDNNRAVHGRSPYTPRFDGSDRWLKRTFTITDLDVAARDLEGRIVATRFLQHQQR
jgi:L-asparagine oxygenase